MSHTEVRNEPLISSQPVNSPCRNAESDGGCCCSGVEDLAAGLWISESPDGGRWPAVGSDARPSPHTDRLHLQLSVSLQHSSGVSLPGRRLQRRVKGG